MASCAIFDTDGQLINAPVADISQCSGVVLMTATDYQTLVVQSRVFITNSADAVSIASAFVGLLALAFCFRVVAGVISDSSTKESE